MRNETISIHQPFETINGKAITIFKRKETVRTWDNRSMDLLKRAALSYFNHDWNKITRSRRDTDMVEIRRMIFSADCEVWEVAQRHYVELGCGRDRTTIIHAIRSHKDRKGVYCWKAYNADYHQWLVYLKNFVRTYKLIDA